MPLSNITYPITQTSGQFSNNIFPSQQSLFFTARRIDQTINTITSGTNGVVRINCSSALIDVGLGDHVAWGSDAYTARTSLVINVIDPNTIEVDETFSSTDTTNSFINYLKDYFLEIRYVLEDSTSDDQSAIELIRDYSQVPNDIEGNIEANIAVPSDQTTPTIESSTQFVEELSIAYKIQYRESYQGTRDGVWVSPTDDGPILLVHAAESASEGFTDTGLTKLFTQGYPIYYSFVYSDINEAMGNDITISFNQYDIAQNLISNTALSTVSDVNGVLMVVVLPNQILSNTVFVEFESSVVSSSGQYDPTQYDPAQYA